MRYVNLLWILLISSAAFADGDAVAAGKAVYSQTCFACHGANGKGVIPGVADLTDAKGALAMPPLGGNPALTEADVKAVLAYLRAEFGQ